MEQWVCDFCGQTGVTDDGETTDQVLCPDCGEPVTPR
jgi:DNA-directed RNA polymerase subunit RPC12/RpoP